MTLRNARARRAKVAARTENMAFPKEVSPKKTKHGRRDREFGRMAYAHWRGSCGVLGAWAEEFGGEPALAHTRPGPCTGRNEYMHLHLEEGAGRRRAPDRQGELGCEGHHEDIDGDLGGKGTWYVRLGWENQLRLRRRLVARQSARWDALSPEERAFWDARAAVRE